MNSVFIQRQCRNVAFLRYGEEERQLHAGNDWDLAVRDPDHFARVAEDCFGEPLIHAKRSYVEQRFYEWGGLDALPVFEWNGWAYLERDRFWKKVTIHSDGIPRPCLAHDAFIAWFCGFLHGGNYNEKYDGLIRHAALAEQEEFRVCLEWAFGKDWAEELLSLALAERAQDAVDLKRDLRKALIWQSLTREGILALSSVCQHWLMELKNHLYPPFPWIAFLGPDGSGKSTVIDGVREELGKSRILLRHVHWRPTVRTPIPEEQGPPVTDPHGRPKRNVVLSLAALGLLFIRWWLGYLLRLLHLRAKIHVVLSDRYYLDLLVDQHRYLYGGPVWLAKWLFRFFPKPELTFVLLTDADTILARKAEVEKPELERQLEAYRKLTHSLGEKAVVIDVSHSAETVIGEVMEKVNEFFRARTNQRKKG